MKWKWKDFGVIPPDRTAVIDVLTELVPEIASGSISVVTTSCDLEVLKVAYRPCGNVTGKAGFLSRSQLQQACVELGVERIQEVLWSSDMRTVIIRSFEPARVEDVFLHGLPQRATVIVERDQLSAVVGCRGQNLALTSQLCGWDIDVLTADEFVAQKRLAAAEFAALPVMTELMAQQLIDAGYFSLDDVVAMSPLDLQQIVHVTHSDAAEIIREARTRVT